MKYKVFFTLKGQDSPTLRNVSSEDLSKLYEILRKYGAQVFNAEETKK